MWKKYNNKIALALAAILVISSVGISALVFPKTASASCGGGYSFCRAVNVCLTSQCPANQTNFTVLICANATMGNGNACATVSGLNQTGGGANVKNSNGYDITFWTSSNCTGAMNWETEKYVASTGELEAYVLIPSLLAAGNTFYMCYGNASISTFQGGSTGSAWNSNYKGVWHLPNGSTLTANDSTSNANNGIINGATAITGQIDGGTNITQAGSQNIDLGNNSSLQISGAVTVCAWLNLPSYTSGFVTVFGGTDLSNSYAINEGSSGNYYFRIKNGGTQYFGGNNPIPALNTWHYLCGEYDGSSAVSLYYDGAFNGGGSASGSIGTGGHIAFSDSTVSFKADEGRISNIALSPNWITTDYNNQSAPNSFESFGSEQSNIALTHTAAAFQNAAYSFQNAAFSFPGN